MSALPDQCSDGPDPERLDDLPLNDPHFSDARLTAAGLLFEAAGGLAERLRAQWAQHGLTQAEFEVLLRIARTPGQALRMTDLATQTVLTTSGITRVVDRLERDRLVQRQACPTDRRGAFAALTNEGATRLDAVLPGHLDLLERWFTGVLSADSLTTLLCALRTIRDAVRPDATAGA